MNSAVNVSRLAEGLQTVTEAVQRYQEKASGHQKEIYDFKASSQYYLVGELVWVKEQAWKRSVSETSKKV